MRSADDPITDEDDMTGAEITDLFKRLARLVEATEQKAGEGTAWDYTFPDGETHRYILQGLKSHAKAEDDAFNLLIWIGIAKDYLKQRAKALGKDDRSVEDAVHADRHLPICADLANLLKHGRLNRSHSGRYPRLEKLSFEIPQAAFGKLTFRALEVELQIADPSLVEFHLPIIDQTGEQIGDAFEYAGMGLASLEKLRADIGGE